jgi:protein TonB
MRLAQDDRRLLHGLAASAVCHIAAFALLAWTAASASTTEAMLAGQQSVLTVAFVAESSVKEPEFTEAQVQMERWEIPAFEFETPHFVSLHPPLQIDPCPLDVPRAETQTSAPRLTMTAVESVARLELPATTNDTLRRADRVRPRRQPEMKVPSPKPTPRRTSSRPLVTASASVAIPEMTGTVETTSARPLSNPAPEYPPEALRRAIHGRVLLRITISPDGVVSGLEIAETSGYRVLDDTAADAVERWQFEPARRNGTPVESTVLLPIRFLPR